MVAMRQSYVLLVALLLGGMLTASCSVKEIEAGDSAGVVYESFIGTTESSSDTKVYADEQLHVLWSADDRISLFNKNTSNLEYRFEGEPGSNYGIFSKVDDNASASGSSLQTTYAVYPYKAANSVNDNGVLSVEIPSRQAYAEGTFAPGVNVMAAATNDQYLTFKNLCGILAVKLYGSDISVKSITLKGNNNERIAGSATVTITPGEDPVTEMAQNASTAIELVSGVAIALPSNSSEYKEFWFMLPPTTFTKGFTVTVNTQNNSFPFSTEKQLTVARNTITRMAVSEVAFKYTEPDAVDLGLPSGTLWASFNLGATSPSEPGYYYAWGETMPKNSFSWKTYKWSAGNDVFPLTAETIIKYSQSVDGKTILDPEDDAAAVNLGGDWRMPTKEEIKELKDNCDWTPQGDGSWKIQSRSNGNSISLSPSGIWLSGGIYIDSDYDGHCYNYASMDYLAYETPFWASTYDPVNTMPATADANFGLMAYEMVDGNASGANYALKDCCFRYVGLPIRPVKSGNSPAIQISTVSNESKDGYPLISVLEFYGNQSLKNSYPFIPQLTSIAKGRFLFSSPINVSYSISPQDTDIYDYSLGVVNCKTTSIGNNMADLASLLQVSSKSGGLFDVRIQTMRAVNSSSYNELVALRAIPNTGGDPVVSDYAIVESDQNYSYSIINKRDYSRVPRFVNKYRTDYIDVDDNNQIDLYLRYDSEIDLLDYLETYAEQKWKTLSDMGITPTYHFYFAGMNKNTSKVVIGMDSELTPYENDNGRNYNSYIQLNGSKISVNPDLAYTAPGATPLIYVRAWYNNNGKLMPLAECMLKIMVVKEEVAPPVDPEPGDPEPGDPVAPMSWETFIEHSVTFKYDDLTPLWTINGNEGSVYANHFGYSTACNKLSMDWKEFEKWVLNDPYIGMSFEEFAQNYITEPVFIVRKTQGGSYIEPGATCPIDNCYTIGAGDLMQVYGPGLNVSYLSPSNWNASNYGINISLNSDVTASNIPHYVYALYPAKDATKYPGVVIKFTYKVTQ